MSGYRSVFSSFGFGRRGRNTPDVSNANSEIVRLEPVGRKLPEKRSAVYTTGNLTERLEVLLAPAASSGAAVNERSALGVAAFIACVGLISDMIGKLPVELIKKTNKGPKVVTDHPAARLVSKSPGELHTPFELKKMVMSGKVAGGNGYARVFRDAYNQPSAIEWIRPCDITPQFTRGTNGERIPIYRIEGEKGFLTRSNIIHVKNESLDGLIGMSTVHLLRESLGTSLSQTAAAGKMMKNGTHFPGFLVSNSVLPKDKIDDARDDWDRNSAGSLNTGRVPILNGQFDFKQTNGMSMVDAEFMASRRFELQEICRFFRVQPFLVGDSSASTTWGTGIQEMTLGFLNFCLDPHLVAFEEALNRSLLTTDEIAKGYYFRFDRDELASVSRQDTAAYFQTMRNIGVYSANDIRRKLDEPVISTEDGGDDYGRPFNASGGTPQFEAKPKPETVTA